VATNFSSSDLLKAVGVGSPLKSLFAPHATNMVARSTGIAKAGYHLAGAVNVVIPKTDYPIEFKTELITLSRGITNSNHA
jgi:hypothetical protein